MTKKVKNDNGFKAVMQQKESEDLLDILKYKRSEYTHDAILDLCLVLKERNVDFELPKEISGLSFEGGIDKSKALAQYSPLKIEEEINEDFEGVVYQAAGAQSLAAFGGVLLIFGVGLFALYFGVMGGLVIALGFGALVIVGGFFVVSKYKNELKGGKSWMDLIRNERNKIVWIKPVLVKEKAALVVTVNTEKEYHLLTSDDRVLKVKCSKLETEEAFLKGVEKYLFKAHFGYSESTQLVYNENPELFYRMMKIRGELRMVNPMK